MTTTIEPSTIILNGDNPPTVQAHAEPAGHIRKGDIITNMGIVDSVTQVALHAQLTEPKEDDEVR